MYISKKWLKKYIPAIDQIPDSEIELQLTRTLAEVESVKRIGDMLNKLVVGEVVEVAPHPDADKLRVCKIDIGTTNLQIVTGAPNIKENIRVVVCLPGGSVISPETNKKLRISETKLRGVDSQGMICSERELGISDEHEGVLILSGGFKIGDDFDDFLRDSVFEIENKSLTHRGDCFSHLGIARELAAIFDLEFTKPEFSFSPVQTDSLALEIQVETVKSKRLDAIVLKNVKVRPSPIWLKQALKSIGIRPVNNVVDITNYVMHDIGQPLHAYDFGQVYQSRLIVRESRAGEKIQTIDHKEHTLPEGIIVVADKKKLLGVAGVMGSKASEINQETNNIVLEAGIFASENVITAQRALGSYSEAGVRMGKHIDPNMTLNAIHFAANLIQDLAEAEVASEVLEVCPETPQTKSFTVDLQTVPQILGIGIPIDTMLLYLERLGIKIHNRKSIDVNPNLVNVPKLVELEIPSWRNDLNIPADIVEEIARLHGYDKIQPNLPVRELKPLNHHESILINRRLRSAALKLRFNEIISYSFISEKTRNLVNIPERQLLKVVNSISPELNYVRNSISVSLLEAIAKNFNPQKSVTTELSLFEIGRAIDPYNYTSEKIPQQDFHFAFAANYSIKDNLQARESGKKQLLKLKGKAEAIIKYLGINEGEYYWRDYQRTDNIYLETLFHPFRRSTLVIAGKVVGWFGEVHPQIATQITGLDNRISVFEINISSLLSTGAIDQKKFLEISRFPSSNRDISFWVPQGTDASRLLHIINNSSKNFTEVRIIPEIIDEYYNEKGDRSVTFAIEIQPLTKTLTDKEVTNIVSRLSTELEKQAKLRIRS